MQWKSSQCFDRRCPVLIAELATAASTILALNNPATLRLSSASINALEAV